MRTFQKNCIREDFVKLFNTALPVNHKIGRQFCEFPRQIFPNFLFSRLLSLSGKHHVGCRVMIGQYPFDLFIGDTDDIYAGRFQVLAEFSFAQ